MSGLNEAVRLAIKGGYKAGDRLGLNQTTLLAGFHSPFDRAAITQDPHFWLALGKALEFDGDIPHYAQGEPMWKTKAHQYFELVLTGGDQEKFWKELIISK